MTEQEFLARDAALLIEINEKQKNIESAYQTLWAANVDITQLQAERIKLRHVYERRNIPLRQIKKSKQGGQHHD